MSEENKNTFSENSKKLKTKDKMASWRSGRAFKPFDMGMSSKRKNAKVETRSNLKKTMDDEGIFAAILSHEPPFGIIQYIIDQPCLVMPSTVKDNLSKDGYVNVPFKHMKSFVNNFQTESGTNSGGSVVKQFMEEILSFFLFNPFFYWYSEDKSTKLGGEESESEYYWGHTQEWYEFIYKNFVTKFIFCIFKIVGSPLIILYYALLLFYIFLLSLRLDQIGASIFGMLRIIFVLGPTHFYVPYKNTYIFNKDTQEVELSEDPQDKIYGFFDSLIYLLGTIIPYQLFLGTAFGKTYGQGGLLILILIFMAISAVIIILGGFNILILIGVFLVYFYKVIYGLGEASTQK